MIESFRCKETEKIFNREYSKRFPREIQRVAIRKLTQLHTAISLQDLKSPPANQLEKLVRDRKGQWSICINDQYRICFNWHNGKVYEVEIIDYH